MVNSTLPLRRVVTAVALAVCLCLTACTSFVPSTKASYQGAAAHREASPALANQSALRAGASVYEQRVADFEYNAASLNSHVQRIRYADALLHLGEPRKAITVLVETELVFPDAYLNALYLGLAYEMAGDLRSARYWVTKGIERNPDSRGGSEWLHLAMVDARLALAQNSEWLKSHTVLENNTHRSAEEILSAIKIQLAVRGDFGLLPDRVVCDLYFEAGVCAPNIASRREFFSQSLELGSLRQFEIEKHEKIRAMAQSTARVN